MDTRALYDTIGAAELLGEAWAAREAGDAETVTARLSEPHGCCGAQVLALLWAAVPGQIPSPDDPAWPDFIELQRWNLNRKDGTQ